MGCSLQFCRSEYLHDPVSATPIIPSKEDLHKTIFCNASNRRVIMHHSVQMAALAEEAELCKGGISGCILVLWDDAFSSLTSQLAPLRMRH
jgi:hypothetical protein